MGYGQWVSIPVVNNSDTITLSIQHVNRGWGKLHYEASQERQDGQEIEPSQMNGTKIGPDSQYRVNASGRAYTWSGCDGSFDVYTNVNGRAQEKLCTVRFDCPWSGSNSFSVNDQKEGWEFDVAGWNSSGALGNVAIGIWPTEEKKAWMASRAL